MLKGKKAKKSKIDNQAEQVDGQSVPEDETQEPEEAQKPRRRWFLHRQARAKLALAEVIIHDLPHPERYTLPLAEAQAKLPRDAMYHVNTTGSTYGHLIIAGLFVVMGVVAFWFLGGTQVPELAPGESTPSPLTSLAGIVMIVCWALGGVAYILLPKYLAGRVTLPKFYVDSEGRAISPVNDRSDDWVEFLGGELAKAKEDGVADTEVAEGVDFAGILERRIATLKSGRTDPPYSPYVMGQIENMEAATRFFTMQESMRADRGGGVLRMAVILGITIFGMLAINDAADGRREAPPSPEPTVEDVRPADDVVVR